MDFTVVMWQVIVQMELNGLDNIAKLFKIVAKMELIGAIMLVCQYLVNVLLALFGMLHNLDVLQRQTHVLVEHILMVIVAYHTLIALVIKFGVVVKYNVFVLKQHYGMGNHAFLATMDKFMD